MTVFLITQQRLVDLLPEISVRIEDNEVVGPLHDVLGNRGGVGPAGHLRSVWHEVRKHGLDAHLNKTALQVNVAAVKLVVEAKHIDAGNHLATLLDDFIRGPLG